MDSKIDAYIKKLKTPQKQIAIKLRKIITKTFPGIKEEMKWGVPVYGDGKYYIGALKSSVNLGFSINGLSNEEIKNFNGSGKTMRHIKIYSLKDVDEKDITRLLKIVKKRCKA